MPKRWVVEHILVWLEKSRRLWKSGERLLRASLPFVYLASWLS
jgi:IS1480 transposase,